MGALIYVVLSQLLCGWCAYFVAKAKRLDPITCATVAMVLPLVGMIGVVAWSHGRECRCARC
jgi:LytS/YehU family sensor histidine kinase